MPRNINTMTHEELAALEGIDDKLATAIIALRTEGALADLEELRQIEGIGPKRIEQLLAQRVVCGPADETAEMFTCCSCGRTLPIVERNPNCVLYSSICDPCCTNLYYDLYPRRVTLP